MRLVPRKWHNETWICSIRGHFVPAARAARLREEDRALAQDAGDGTRFVRCLRCDGWFRIRAPSAGETAYEEVPPLDALRLPRRGKALEDAIVIRLIAIDRGVHAALFTLLAAALFLVKSRLPGIRSWAESLVEALREPIQSTSPGGSHSFLNRQLERLMDLQKGQVEILLATATVYAVVEGIEAVYLWKEKRWAEYLTVLATLGFVPFEIHELAHKVTAPRILALLVNLAVLVWLSWNKHLFGLRGGAKALAASTDWKAVLAQPETRDLRLDPSLGRSLKKSG